MYINKSSIKNISNISKILEESLVTKMLWIKLRIYFDLFKKFGLDYDEFQSVVFFIYKHFYLNESNLSDIKEMRPIFKKMNTRINLPSRIYRGLFFKNFKESKDFKEFVTDLKNKKISTKGKVLSWSSDKKISEHFAKGYNVKMEENDIGIMINLPKKDYKSYFITSFYFFFKDDKEFQDFLKFVYEYAFVKDSKITKKITLKNDSFYRGAGFLNGLKWIKFEKEILTYPINLQNVKNIKFDIFHKSKKIKTLNYEEMIEFN